MTEVESAQTGLLWDHANNVNNIMDNGDEEIEDLENNSAKLFERSRIKALAGEELLFF